MNLLKFSAFLFSFILCLKIINGNAKETTRVYNGPDCVRLGGKCYEFSTTGKSWFQAESYCRRNQGYLANIANKNEMDLIKTYLLTNDLKGWDLFWIDGTDLADEGTFRLMSNGKEMPFTDWCRNEPNNLNNNENCVDLYVYKKEISTVGMNDDLCTIHRSYICEYELALTILPATNQTLEYK